MDKVFHFSFAYIVRPEISISVEFLCGPASDPKGRTIRKLMGVGEIQKKYSRKGKLNEKKFLRLENSPPPPPHNFSNRPSLIKRNFRQAKVLHV